MKPTGNAVNPTMLIAWSPSKAKVALGAILCSPVQSMDRDMYFRLLGDRIQRMVDLSDDPEAAAVEFADIMDRQGLWYPESVSANEIGNHIVWSNPAAHERLNMLRVFDGLAGRRPVEMPEAREQIEADAEDPHSSLLSWAGFLDRY